MPPKGIFDATFGAISDAAWRFTGSRKSLRQCCHGRPLSTTGHRRDAPESKTG
jgi:hypothetical protein